ncbi:MAG: hypothetical protein Q8919_06070 [Bacteroidota bacterium]|nr:hypothetical protein [Bacteroidota bacterium]
MQHTRFRAIVIAGILLLFSFEAKAQSDGYVSPVSVAQGGKIRFYISTGSPTFTLSIFKLGFQKREILALHDVPGGIQTIGDSAFINGCNWKVTKELTIPDVWASGVYEADFPSADTMKKLIFIVREKELGKHSKILVCLTTNTWQAYNNWGGRSLYDFNSYSQTASVKISLNRPLADTSENNYFRWTDKLVRWLDAHNIDAEYCINTDLDRDPNFLSHYKVYVPVGHDEYWSKPERNAVENFVRFGGRMICLSGNTCWWQVRFEDSLQTMVCYRDSAIDPMYPMHDSIVTSNWGRSPVNDPPNSLFGVSFEHGGFINDNGIFPKFFGYGGYTVFNSQHWIYDETGVKDGDVIGAQDAIAGYEADGALFDWLGGLPYPTGEDKTPKNFSILGISPAASAANLAAGHATMGYFTNASGGAVFNGGSTDWVSGLDGDDSVQSQMLLNVFHGFSFFGELPPEITGYSPARMTTDSINHEWVNINHLSMRLESQQIDTFVIHGRCADGKKPLYFWRIDGKTISFDSIFYLTPEIKKKSPSAFILEGCASSGFDKAVVQWAIVDTTMRFVTSAPTVPSKRHSFFSYHAVAASLVDEHPAYVMIYGPSWLHIDRRGVVSGWVADEPGDHTVILRATDSKGNFDMQTFNIHVSDSLEGVEKNSESALTLQCFPNPISEDAHFLYTLGENGYVQLEITDVAGKQIYSSSLPNITPAGPHLLGWNCRSTNGERLHASIYFCRLILRTLSGAKSAVFAKLVVL